jgi:glycosyltransferase involved in cell wall biosynthesis
MRHFFVVTPVLNGERFIEATLASLDAQTWSNWTHYVVDGGSSDGTAAIVRHSMQSQPRRRFMQGPDRGLYDGVLKGFAQARADGCRPDDILLWLNSDDLLAPWAFATMAKAFDEGADWVTALPGQWDSDGRLVLVQPSAWYPRALIRQGLFTGRGLGWIQQESTFFTRRLLDMAAPQALNALRETRMAGDFLLWREFARHRPLVAIPTVIGGFRAHGGNASVTGLDHYYREIAQAGVFVPPRLLGRLMRMVYRFAACLATVQLARRTGIALGKSSTTQDGSNSLESK